MNAHRRYWDERPWAAAVRDSVNLISEHKPSPGAAQAGALIAVAYAVLDLSDSVRHLADRPHRKDQP